MISHALTLTTLAGLATALGAAVAFLPRGGRTLESRVLAAGLALAATVMLYVSLIELLPEAIRLAADWLPVLSAALAGGLLVIALEHFLPQPGKLAASPRSVSTVRVGLLSALALGLHNFPEGAAVFVSNLEGEHGLALALAVGVHNIPEGVAVALPLYYATGRRGLAFAIAVLSGLSEPLGALLAWAVLAPFLNSLVMSVLYASVAGMMLTLSLHTLLPAMLRVGVGTLPFR